jgi:hypothetical protein
LSIFAFNGIFLWGESSGASTLALEIQNLEQSLNPDASSGRASSISGVQRYEILLRLARLHQLSGNRAAAAAAWNEAAYASPAKRDDAALLESAGLFISLGDYDKAEKAIKTVLFENWEINIVRKARYLGVLMETFRYADSRVLRSLAEDDDFLEYRSGIYYALWHLSGEVFWKTRLVSEFPQSPEAFMVNEGKVILAAAAYWFLFPGRGSVILEEAEKGLTAAAAQAGNMAPENPSGLMLQTGLYNREENARIMENRLKNAGFRPLLIRRKINGNEYWAVAVESGQDINADIIALKNAGFDAFPVFE